MSYCSKCQYYFETISNYLNSHPEVLSAVVSLMAEKQRMLDSGYVLLDQRALTARKAAVDIAHSHFSRMSESVTRSADLARDSERYLREWRIYDL